MRVRGDEGEGRCERVEMRVRGKKREEWTPGVPFWLPQTSTATHRHCHGGRANHSYSSK